MPPQFSWLTKGSIIDQAFCSVNLPEPFDKLMAVSAAEGSLFFKSDEEPILGVSLSRINVLIRLFPLDINQ
jgi:hypothetical protein